ncbi:MAG: hypothetical protein IJE58_09235 [Oscillospiraceae bacterium]|nr:hypothetical protein [Oscillospiraceae bacterium]
MKHIHIPTLLMHIGLLLLARLTINDHPDLFLGVGLIVLTAHVIWACRSRRDFHTAHTLGMLLTLSAEYFGWVRIRSGAFAGGGFAWLFYTIALAVSFAVLSVLRIVRMIKRQ